MARDGKVGYEDGFKTCNGCQVRLPVSEFHWQKDLRIKAGGTYKPRCKECERVPALIRHAPIANSPLGQEKGSIIDLAPPREFAAALKRMNEYYQDSEALEQWANAGFTSGYSVIE